MQKKSIEEINKRYKLEIPKIVKTIKKQKAKNILLQFPEGMKPYSQTIASEIESQTNSNCMIWLDSCFGACDIPIETREITDLIIQFGHSKWKFNDKNVKVL
jgi:2-(3-amino-3-carboxypropyl)histidine synthase